jgi:hypothetical protein
VVVGAGSSSRVLTHSSRDAVVTQYFSVTCDLIGHKNSGFRESPLIGEAESSISALPHTFAQQERKGKLSYRDDDDHNGAACQQEA